MTNVSKDGECWVCGAHIENASRHDRWHEELEAALNKESRDHNDERIL